MVFRSASPVRLRQASDVQPSSPVAKILADLIARLEQVFAMRHLCYPPDGYELSGEDRAPLLAGADQALLGPPYECPECGRRWHQAGHVDVSQPKPHLIRVA